MDIVITYVDNKDINWQNEFKKQTIKTIHAPFNSYDLLEYNFRSIECNLPFIENIHLVVQQESQLSKWINKLNPKLKIHYHNEFIPKEFLPTFNSNIIEFFFYKIKDLSENFIYINDDMYFPKKCEETDFFINDLPVDSDICTNEIYCNRYIENKNLYCPFNYLIKQNLNKINCTKYYRNYHVAIPYKKSEIEKLHNTINFTDDYIKISCIRNKDDWFLWNNRYKRLIDGTYIKNNELYENETKYYHTLKESDDISQYKMICVNFKPNDILRNQLNTLFPNKSSFEL